MSHGINWVEVGSIATAAAAVATAYMAHKTRRLADETKDGVEASKLAAEATREAAQATRDDADATLRLVEQGRWAYQPVLAAEIPEGFRSGGDRPSVPIKITNVGPGPAIGCVCAFLVGDEGHWRRTPQFHLSAATDIGSVPAGIPSLPVNYAWFRKDPPLQAEMYPIVLFCRDMFERRYRFGQDADGHVYAPQVIEAIDAGPPSNLEWRTDPDLWPFQQHN